MDQQENKLSIFRYNAILSVLFFIVSTFYLGARIEGYSFAKFTISGMSQFLDRGTLSFFNSLFFVKAIMDMSFAYAVIKYYGLKFYHFSAACLLISIMSFGLLGFFPTHAYKQTHLILVYIIFIFWFLTEYLFAGLTKSESFRRFTGNLLLIQLVSALLFLLLNFFNAIFEAIFLLSVFLWLIIFINRYLK